MMPLRRAAARFSALGQTRAYPALAGFPERWRWWLALPLAGAAAVFGFAPFYGYPLPFLSMAVLFLAWRRCSGPRSGAGFGLAWGLGFFLAGVSWVYVSLHDVGGMAAPLAGGATLLFCTALAAYPALAGYVFCRVRSGRPLADALLAAGLWTLAEGLRGGLFTGFPWLSLGYSQIPDGPLAGFAPVIGVHGVGALLALCAALPVFVGRRGLWWAPVAAIMTVAAVGFGLRDRAWTEPSGEPLTVSLLQGNIPQTIKWVPEYLPRSIETYLRLAREHPAQLLVLPETALPLTLDRIPEDVLAGLTRHGDVILGAAARTAEGGYVNAAVRVDPDLRTQIYAKTHLVPFGEFVPPGFTAFFNWVNIPMADFTAGASGQPPFAIAGQRPMPNICYEDVFGDEIRRTVPEATLLLNLSNTAWFGRSLAQPQHLQIAQTRALETGRPMLRATNTGMTAAIMPDGRVEAELPAFTTGALTVTVRGYAGRTPFVRIGNRPVWLFALLACVPALRLRRTSGSL